MWEKDSFKVSYTTETAMSISGIWLLVGLVRSHNPHTKENLMTSQAQLATIYI